MTNEIQFVVPGQRSKGMLSAVKRLNSKLDNIDGCLVWTGCKDRKGYARLKVSGRGSVLVHRLSYEISKGNIPAGLTIDHLCRNRACCNPDHLEAVTNQENIRRGTQGKYNREKTYCRNGHEYSVENTYISPNGGRHCRICKREAGKRSDQRRGRAYAQ